MYEVYAHTAYSAHLLATFATIEEAVEYLRARSVFAEEDGDNPGCWDAITRDGRVLSIEPCDKSQIATMRV